MLSLEALEWLEPSRRQRDQAYQRERAALAHWCPLPMVFLNESGELGTNGKMQSELNTRSTRHCALYKVYNGSCHFPLGFDRCCVLCVTTNPFFFNEP
jgi:hypothetical protein